MWFSHRLVGWNDLGNGFEYKIGNSAMEIIKCHRDMGILVDSELKFHGHVSALVWKAVGVSHNLLPFVSK